MSLYSDYLKEYDGFETLELPDVGFATYKIVAHECYIRDIYVKPEYRKQQAASKLADLITEIAKQAGCTQLIGTVRPSYSESNTSLKVLQSYGFTLGKALPDQIVMYKRLN